jgi:hypothetical protein
MKVFIVVTIALAAYFYIDYLDRTTALCLELGNTKLECSKL